jgi:hypothetical protein
LLSADRDRAQAEKNRGGKHDVRALHVIFLVNAGLVQ